MTKGTLSQLITMPGFTAALCHDCEKFVLVPSENITGASMAGYCFYCGVMTAFPGADIVSDEEFAEISKQLMTENAELRDRIAKND